MHTTYHLKARDIDNHLLDAIRTLFEEDDYLTITIESEIVDNPVGEADLFRFLEIEKKSPPTHVSSALDFNRLVDEINL